MLNQIKKWLNKDLQKEYSRGYNAGLDHADQQLQDIRSYYMIEIEKIKNKHLESWHVEPDLVISVNKTGLILLNGEQLTIPELKNLKSEVHALKEFQIYKILQNTVRQKAIEKAILASTDLYTPKGNEQVLAGKMMVYNLDIIKTIIDQVDKARVVAK